MKKNYITPNYKVVDLGAEEMLAASNEQVNRDAIGITFGGTSTPGPSSDGLGSNEGGAVKSQSIFDDEW